MLLRMQWRCLTSIEAVVAAPETSRKSCDFKAADAIRYVKAQHAQQEYVQQAPIAECFFGHILARQELQEVNVWEPLRPTIANGKLQSMSSQRTQTS